MKEYIVLNNRNEHPERFGFLSASNTYLLV